ncbi:hypothetical protein COY27_01865 [Candidatus Woesearchaeota archaeon CG_4_10_14_0_2_um_filter_33_13]|nr:MAG: hypothetical protein COY27_01865 [Candidatus Woesearchaeota archaeon CG_4_10_14_0_2_um_filter_33_13]
MVIKMKLTQIISTLTLGAALALTPGKARADFFDGMRGPNDVQLDQRVTFSQGSDVMYTLLPKTFIDIGDKGNGIFAVTPLSYSPGKKLNAGVGVGGFLNLGKVGLLGVLPVVYSAGGEVTNINPTLYATITAGNFLFDPRVSYLASINGDTTQHNLSFGVTAGYKIDNVILGFDVSTGFDPKGPDTEQLRQNLNYQGIIRVDLDPQHHNWVQAYLGKDSVGIGFRANFDWR